MIELFRTSNIFRPLSIEVNGKTYELENIIYFNKNGVITQIGSGYFNDDKARNYKGTCARKLKIDFNFEDNFIVKTKDYFEDIKYTLYVYEKNVDIKFLGKEQKYFGEIYSHWQIDDYEHWKYEKSLKDNLNKLNDKAENIIKLIAEKYGYNRNGIEENLLNERIKELKKINRQILKEVETIKAQKV